MEKHYILFLFNYPFSKQRYIGHLLSILNVQNKRGVKTMPLLEISVTPVGTDSTSFSSDVTNAVRKIKEKGLKYQLTPTATVVEGDIDQLWEVARDMHQEAISSEVQRVITNISIDHRTDKQMDMNHQVDTVRQSLE
jgi:uncharacterized protein (TIGR00106 family)